ncbi:4663_t:CDS:2 [Funneliformis geosporum]|nr:4663_t:CDS:2 [Funneliformis geosporum]
MVKFHKVWREIEKANKFSDLPELDKESVKLEFDETKTGFEGTEDADASGLTRIEKEDWYEAETGLAKDGATERIAFNHGWKEPTQIREGETDYKIYDLEITSDIIEQETIKVKVLEVGKAELDQLDFDTELTAQLDNLNYAKLPGGYKRTDLEKLLDNDFIDEFIGQAGEARTFANNPANRAAVLAYRKTGASFLTGAEAGTIYNKGWKNPDLIEINEDEIWAYSKNGKVSVNIAFQVFQNHWLADEFNFDSSNRALIPSYSSYGEPADRNLDATLTDKQQLDKINEIIKRIKTASRSTDLPTEEEINDYDDSKVVNISGKRIKPRAIVKARRQEAKTRLEQNEANKLARTAAIQAIQRY